MQLTLEMNRSRWWIRKKEKFRWINVVNNVLYVEFIVTEYERLLLKHEDYISFWFVSRVANSGAK